ncbi:MAG: class I SAM-dependent methyltransferase [Candidatus Woesearchaeota archaeon]
MAENIESVKKYWEAHPTRGIWNTYEDEMADVYVKERWMPDSMNQLPLSGSLILDVGSGQGTNLYYMLKKGARAYGFDISETAIASSHDKLQKGGFSPSHAFVGNAEHMPFKDNAFDCAIALGVLHHTPNIDKAASELHRVLKPNGIACLMLYKKYTFPHFVIMGARALNRFLMRISNNKFSVFGVIKPNKTKKYGTFFHEMLTCPILRTYSKRDIRRIFSQFRRVRFQTRFTGITRIKDFLPIPPLFNKFLYWLEPKIERTLGFYQVFYLTK